MLMFLAGLILFLVVMYVMFAFFVKLAILIVKGVFSLIVSVIKGVRAIGRNTEEKKPPRKEIKPAAQKKKAISLMERLRFIGKMFKRRKRIKTTPVVEFNGCKVYQFRPR